jgi:hypothetical protein
MLNLAPFPRRGARKKPNEKALFNSFESPRSGYSFEVNDNAQSDDVLTELQDLLV